MFLVSKLCIIPASAGPHGAHVMTVCCPNQLAVFLYKNKQKVQLDQLTASGSTAAACQSTFLVAAAVGCLVATRVVEGELFVSVHLAHREEGNVVPVLSGLRPQVRLQRHE